MAGTFGDAFMSPLLQTAELQQQEAALPGIKAQSEMQQLGVARARQEMADKQKFQNIMQGLGENQTPEQNLHQAADAALRLGMLEQAEKAYNVLALGEQRKARAEEYRMLADEKELKAEHARIDAFSSLASVYPDSAAGWNAIKTAYQAQHPELTPMERQVMAIPWRPGLAKELKTSLLSAKDQGMLEIQEARLKLQEQKTGMESQQRDALLRLREQKLELEKTREQRLTKAGGKNPALGIPTPARVDDAVSVIKERADEEGVKPPEGSSLSSLSRQIASEAMGYVKGGMDWDAALQQAYDDNAGRIKQESTLMGFGKPRQVVGSRSSGGKIGAPPTGGQPARISSDADYGKLPSGALFIAPDGTTRRKP